MNTPEFDAAMKAINDGLDRRERRIAELEAALQDGNDTIKFLHGHVATLRSENARLTAELGILQQVVARANKEVAL